jgi:hypothetical protein
LCSHYDVELALLQRCADVRRVSGVMRRFSEDVPQQTIAGLGDRPRCCLLPLELSEGTAPV